MYETLVFRSMQDNELIVCGEIFFQIVQVKVMDDKNLQMDSSNSNYLLKNQH